MATKPKYKSASVKTALSDVGERNIKCFNSGKCVIHLPKTDMYDAVSWTIVRAQRKSNGLIEEGPSLMIYTKPTKHYLVSHFKLSNVRGLNGEITGIKLTQEIRRMALQESGDNPNNLPPNILRKKEYKDVDFENVTVEYKMVDRETYEQKMLDNKNIRDLTVSIISGKGTPAQQAVFGYIGLNKMIKSYL